MVTFYVSFADGRKKWAKTIQMFLLKGAQVLYFRFLVFCINKSYLGIWLRVWKKLFILKFELFAILYFKLMLCVR